MNLAAARSMILQPSPSAPVSRPDSTERARLRGLLDRLVYTRQEPRQQTLLAQVESAVAKIGPTTTLHSRASLVDRLVEPRCPACGSPVQRDRPSPKSPFLYQCEACDVELIIDLRSGQLFTSPFAPPPDP